MVPFLFIKFEYIGKILVQGIVAGLGNSAITANAVAGTVGGLGILPASATGLALITVVGRCVGARDYDAVKKYTLKVAVDTDYMGYILIADEIKEGVGETITMLKQLGVKRTVMQTGDHALVAKEIVE